MRDVDRSNVSITWSLTVEHAAAAAADDTFSGTKEAAESASQNPGAIFSGVSEKPLPSFCLCPFALLKASRRAFRRRDFALEGRGSPEL